MEKKAYILNAFSVNMLNASVNEGVKVDFNRVSTEKAKDLLDAWERSGFEIVSAVGHADTAGLFSGILGREVPQNRINVVINTPESMGVRKALLGQYVGPRLAEGCTTLPEGAAMQWYEVVVRSEDLSKDVRYGS